MANRYNRRLALPIRPMNAPLHDLIALPIGPDILRGAIDIETTTRGLLPHRLPAWARAQYPDPQLAMAESQPSGVRLVLRTTATLLELDTLPTRHVYAGVPPRPLGMYDLLVDGERVAQTTAIGGDVVTIDMRAGTVTKQEGPVATLRFEGLPPRDKRVEIWLPYHEITEVVALRGNAPAHPVADDGRRVWLHHGSSISHGSNGASPTTIWTALAAAAGGVDLLNLGFSGSALLDPFVARTMRDTPADVLSVKIGINLVNADLMRMRAFVPAVHGFLDTLRDGHPETPLLIVSPIYCPIHETTPGPGAFDVEALAEGKVMFLATGNPADSAAGKLTLETIRRELARIVEQRAKHDPHLHYLDGRELYGPADHETLPLPDRLHPDAETHRLMAERFAAKVFAESGPFTPL
ncbi:MAG: hypothetical protein GAK28_01936 [Luteibacter sp.]|uniref:GDSL-type esterase/lipase family protein n=1 Tax=Luteibacter sp. TaxID=1886636 RepID=UPI00138654A9|nr:GDSL-type esterase/lipase family protein [Luteibacter sp.]KAF1007297.1 MAG: hypothetical protein GAK28_01936 [Luteibacter sp.]